MKTNKAAAIVLVALSLALVAPWGAMAQNQGMGVFGNPQEDRLGNDLRMVNGLVRAGDYVRAIDALDRLSTTHGDDPRITELYKQAFKLGKMYPRLEELLRTELAKNPKNPILLSDLGEARFLQNDEAAADSLWWLALEIGRGDEMAYRYVADAHLRYGLYDEAIAVYLAGRRNLGRGALFSMELASIYEAQRQYVQAIDEYIVQLYEAPDQIGTISIRIRGLVEDSQDPKDIVATLNARLKAAPGRTELYELLGDLYIKLGQMDKAFECYREIGSRLNDDGQSLIRFATRAYDSKAYSTAVSAADEYSKVSKKKNFADMATLIKARAQQAAGQYEEALGNYRTLAAASTDYRIKDEAGFACGLILAERRGDCDSAMAAWSEMLQTARDPVMSNKARIETAVCHIKKGEYDLAEALLAKIINSNIPDPSIERALFLAGETRFYSGDFKAADEIFRQMVRQFPNASYSNDALTRIDVLLLAGEDSSNARYLAPFAEAMRARLTGRHAQAAEILSDSTFEGSPVAEQALFYSGVSFAAANDADGAIGVLRSYIDKYPDGLYTDRAYLEIGDLYGLRPDTYPEARAAYNIILELYPNGPVTEIARQRLRQIAAPGKVG